MCAKIQITTVSLDFFPELSLGTHKYELWFNQEEIRVIASITFDQHISPSTYNTPQEFYNKYQVEIDEAWLLDEMTGEEYPYLELDLLKQEINSYL